MPDEPPPPYESLGQPAAATISSQTTPTSLPPQASNADATSPTTTASNAPGTTGASAGAGAGTNSNTSHNPFLAPEETSAGTAAATSPHPSSSTNPFLSQVSPQQTGASSTTAATVAPVATSQAPSLPQRNHAAQSPSLSLPEPSRPSIDSGHSRHSSIASPVSPSSASVYAPPPGPPPTTSTSSSPSTRPPARPTEYRPTTVPTPGQPLLRKGKLLVYPRNWPGCPKCHDTGYKHGDPNNPHKSCWDRYGKTYTSAMSYSVGLNHATDNFQKPLPMLSGPPTGAMPPRPSHSYVPGGYPGAGGGGYGNPTPGALGYAAYRPPMHAPPPQPRPSQPPRTPPTPNVDAETEGARMSDVPPNYHDASNVSSSERLPSQYVPPPMPPPGHPGSQPARPPPPPGPSPYGVANPYNPPPPRPGVGGFVGGFGPNPGGPNPYVSVQPLPWHASRPPPPGALVVLPGDPRIGGRLCFECGGRGLTESFWFGDETCFRCRGSGRIF